MQISLLLIFLTLWFVLKSFRTNHAEMSWKRAVLKIFTKLHKETPAIQLYFYKVAGLHPNSFSKPWLYHMYFQLSFSTELLGTTVLWKCDCYVISLLLSATNSLMCHNIKFHYMTFLWWKNTSVFFPKKYSAYFHNFF